MRCLVAMIMRWQCTDLEPAHRLLPSCILYARQYDAVEIGALQARRAMLAEIEPLLVGPAPGD